MPFTPSHAAAVLPFLRTPLPASALVAGSVAPDLPYYLPGDLSWETHSALAVVTTDLLLGGIAAALAGLAGYLWGALAVLTCPCHLPILAIVLAGTTAGAFIGEHWGIAALTLTGLFVLSVTRLLRAFRGRS